MKRIALIIIAVLSALLCSCAVTEESGFEYTYSAICEADSVIAHFFGESGEESLEVGVTGELTHMLLGEWEEASGQNGGEKVLTLTVGTQHEITFFDNGRAMIYYGYAGVLEKDRKYYEITLDSDVDSLYNYCKENGTVPETEE